MRIATIGLGLIGGSALLALSQGEHELIGYDADPLTRKMALAAAGSGRSARWRVTHTVAEAVCAADLVLVAVPLPAVEPVFGLLADEGYAGVVSDLTSVKRPVLRLARNVLARCQAGFVGGHPMAGKETSGFAAADPALFGSCSWVLCLEPDTELDDWLTLAELAIALGAKVVPTTAEEHDQAVALISHLPHLLATALAACAGRSPLALSLAAGSFRDGTRVASTRSELIAAMCGGNASAVLPALDTMLAELAAARDVLEGQNPISDLRPWLSAGHQARLAWESSAVDPCPQPVALPATAEELLRAGRAGGRVVGVAPDRQTVTAEFPDADLG